ncbi:DUF4913 domain-containing protein [Curtobacterium sp. VKM Ac-1395]|nr:DUF4913 domain-containing protein [Curtobacterium sp. VKM Ac-1395]
MWEADEVEDDEVAEPETYFGSVDEFVRDFLVTQYRREISPMSQFRWDARWWLHPEAVSRLEALWRAWEHLRNDPATGMSVWWRDHADHHMGVLLSADGPFGKTSDTTEPGAPLPYAPPPPALYPDVRALPN